MNLTTMNPTLRPETALSELAKHVSVLARLTDGTGLKPNPGRPPVLEQQACLQHTEFPCHLNFFMNKASYPHSKTTYQ